MKGVLEFYDRRFLAPQEGWLSFIETLAGQAAIAIDAELVDDLERSNLELRLAYNTTLEGCRKLWVISKHKATPSALLN